MNKRITVALIVELIPVSTTTYNNNKDVIDFKNLYKFFVSKENTTREKKDYLYSLIGSSRRLKDAIWNAYMREDLYDYTDVPEIDYEEER